MKLEKQVRILYLYTGTLTIGLIVLVVSGFQNRKPKFEEIDVERVNIIEPDGKIRMTISNSQRVPDPVIGGKTLVGARHGAKSAGIIFFNDEGDECGGLGYAGKDGQAGGQLMFDQYHQDQTVGISYSQSGERRSAGLHVWDRPDTPANVLVERMQAIERMTDAAEKKAALDAIKAEAARGELGAQRVFVGKGRDGSAGMTIADRTGKTRVALTIDDKNAAHLQFLDESGKVVYSVPAESGK